MYRKAGVIPPVTSDRYPKRLIIFDSEAYRGEIINGVELQTFRLAVVRFMQLDDNLQIIKNQYEVCYARESLADFIELSTRKDTTLYIYAHNLKYDIQLSGVVNLLLERGWKVSMFVLQDPPSFIRLKSGRLSILFVDTFNYWQFSVSTMGDQLGLAKMSLPGNEEDNRVMVEYCKRDVNILSEYLLRFYRFLDDNHLAGLGLTLASQAFRSYRHKFMCQDIFLHNDKRVTELERDGYTGGRVEAFYIGQLSGKSFYKLDVNSMYPYVMRERLYPYEMLSFSEGISNRRLERLLSTYYVIAEVSLQADKNPFALRDKHKLLFPSGRFRSVLHHSELSYALENNYLLSIHRVAVYKRGDIFSSYVDYFYHLKQASDVSGDKITRQMAKTLLNSLYGKFGQREVVSKIVDNPQGFSYNRVIGYSETLGRSVEVNYIGNQIEVRYKGGESAYSFPAIAGAVTAYARMYLWSLMQTAGLENVYYVDTDSLIVEQAGYDRLQFLLHPDRLGAIKLEGVSDYLEINGAKDYRFGSEIKHKGLPKNAIQLAPGLWQYSQFRGAYSWMKQGMPLNVEVYQRTKERKTPYDKGYVTPSGYVLPLRLDRG